MENQMFTFFIGNWRPIA